MESLEDRRVLATTITVDNFIDELDADRSPGDTSLREAIADANTGDTIIFSSPNQNETIPLTMGELLIDHTLKVDASMLNSLTIDATGASSRIFNITDPSSGTSSPWVTLKGLTLTGGDVNGNGGAIQSLGRLIIQDSNIVGNKVGVAGEGGGIYVNVAGWNIARRGLREVLKIENSTIDGNEARAGGGVKIVSGVPGTTANYDTFTITNTTISNNDLLHFLNDAFGGGVSAELHGAKLTVTGGTSFSSNDAVFQGGGLYVSATDGAQVTVENSSFQQNTSDDSGAGIALELDSQATATLRQLNVLNNTASGISTNNGGGLDATATDGAQLTIEDSLFQLNTADDSGGGIALQLASEATVMVSRLQVLDNTANGAISPFDVTRRVSGGGGVYIDYLQDGTDDPGQDATVTIDDSTISGNRAEGTAMDSGSTFKAGQGGGILVNMASNRTDPHAQSFNSKFTLTRSEVSSNIASDKGGGVHLRVYAGGEATIQDSSITGNESGLTPVTTGVDSESELPYSGGGIYAYLFSGDLDSNGNPLPSAVNDDGIGKLTIAGSTIDNNKAGRHGGGIAICAKREDDTLSVRSSVAIYNTTISTNTAGLETPLTPSGEGGGVHIAIFNSSSSTEAEGIDVGFTHTTITKNKAALGGGIYSLVPAIATRDVNTILQNTLVSGNNEHDIAPGTPGDPDNFYGSISDNSSQYNLFGDATDPDANAFFDHSSKASIPFNMLGTGNINNTTNDPALGNLQINGGITKTHQPILVSGGTVSLAIDAGLNSLAKIPFTSTVLDYDQRGQGFERNFDIVGVNTDPLKTVDIGAYEIGSVVNIVDVVISGSASVHDPFSFATLSDIVSPFSISQLATVPVGGIDTISIVFSKEIDPATISSTSLSLTGLRTANKPLPQPNDFSYDPVTRTASWRFTGIESEVDQYLLSLPDTVTDYEGNALDGEWTNPTSIFNLFSPPFPSGDGQAGGEFNFVMTVLPGDATRDNVVDNSDISVVHQSILFGIPPFDFIDGDFTGDGIVNSTDFNLAAIFNIGKNLQTVWVLADMDGDYDVEADDIAFIEGNLGMTGATRLDGDLDGDGVVTLADRDLALEQLGLAITV